MVLTILLCLLLVLLLSDMMKMTKFNLRHIPSIPTVPLFGSLAYSDVKYLHKSISSWAEQLGPIIQLSTAGPPYVIVSSYEGIREVLLTMGKATAGRPLPFCTKYMLNGTGILFSHQPDDKWKSLRMESHKHMKQFGEGMTHLEYVITDVSEDMFSIFKEKSGEIFDPKETVFDAALNSIAFLLTGVRTRTGDALIEKMRTYERTVFKFVGGALEVKYMIYDVRPYWRHFGFKSWRTVESMQQLQESIWDDIKKLHSSHPEANSLFSVLMAHSDQNQNGVQTGKFEVDDVQKTLVSLLLAGVTTTSASFYAMVNILAHRPHIQNKLYEELEHVDRTHNPITLDDRVNMPYCRATLLELLRYVSVVAVGVPHRTIQDVEICGQHIPNDTVIITNLWQLHHETNFWKDPYAFRPERFLDEENKLIPADHPNRKHLMPFGAGPRVCLGESLALARLFMWIATFVQRFTVEPAPGNLPTLSDPRRFAFKGTTRVCPYEVIIKTRDTYFELSTQHYGI